MRYIFKANFILAWKSFFVVFRKINIQIAKRDDDMAFVVTLILFECGIFGRKVEARAFDTLCSLRSTAVCTCGDASKDKCE
jgi:hypothetical protein